jgi:hypothetical protein
MAFTLKLPEVGETVTEGTIERWLKKPGDQVAKYEPIVEVNTDKVNVELPCPVSGTLKEILAQEVRRLPSEGIFALSTRWPERSRRTSVRQSQRRSPHRRRHRQRHPRRNPSP